MLLAKAGWSEISPEDQRAILINLCLIALGILVFLALVLFGLFSVSGKDARVLGAHRREQSERRRGFEVKLNAGGSGDSPVLNQKENDHG